MTIDITSITLIAGQEARVHFRSKWTTAFAAVFAVLSLGIAYFGMVTAGAAGFQGFNRTTISLLNLVLYLIPLVSLVMATLSLTGDKGARELLFSQPVSRAEILIGKLGGLFVALAAAVLGGFSLAGIVVAARVNWDGFADFAFLVGLSLALALVFIVLGALIGILLPVRTKAFGAALFAWFFWVLLYDLLVIGISFLLRERSANLFAFLSLFGNPVDLVRVASLMVLGDATIFGAAGAALLKFLGGPAASLTLLLAGILCWVVLPLLLACAVLRRRNL